MSDALLSIRDLRTYFRTRDGTVKAVDGVSLDLQKGADLTTFCRSVSTA